MPGVKGKSGKRAGTVPTKTVSFRVPISDLTQFKQFVPDVPDDLRWHIKERIKLGIASEQMKLKGLLDRKKEIETEYLTRQAALGSMMDQIVADAKKEDTAKGQAQKILEVYQSFLRDNQEYDSLFAYRELSGAIAENATFEKALLSCFEKNGLPRDLNLIRPLLKNPKKVI